MSWIFFFSNLIFPSFFIQIRQLLLQIRIFLLDAPSYLLYENRPICLQISPIKQPSILMQHILIQHIYAPDKLWYQIPSENHLTLPLLFLSDHHLADRITHGRKLLLILCHHISLNQFLIMMQIKCTNLQIPVGLLHLFQRKLK